jgi:uncharacterized protein VirK/YbjX
LDRFQAGGFVLIPTPLISSKTILAPAIRWPGPALAAGAEAPPAAVWSSPRIETVSIWAAAKVLHPVESRGWRRGRAKFIARAALHPGLTRTWLNRLAQAPEQALWHARPRLAGKLQRPYAHRDWNAAARLAALESHYEALGSLVSAAALDRIYAAGLGLVRIEAAGTARNVRIRLFYSDQFEKEGELTLAVADEATGLELATLTFCVVGTGTERSIWIGGLQANPAPQTRFLINEVSKEMHGLRPKALALWALRQLAQAWEIDRIRAVSDAQHIYQHRHKRRAFAASYDEFWSESGGQRGPDGWELPLETPERPAAEIKPSRRKAYARRYAMLAELAPVLRQSVAALANESPVQPTPFSYIPARASKVSETPAAALPAEAAQACPAELISR